MDVFVNSHRKKVGMPRADVNTLTVSYVIRTLRDCAPDDSVTSDYNKIVINRPTLILLIWITPICMIARFKATHL